MVQKWKVDGQGPLKYKLNASFGSKRNYLMIVFKFTSMNILHTGECTYLDKNHKVIKILLIDLS